MSGASLLSLLNSGRPSPAPATPQQQPQQQQSAATAPSPSSASPRPPPGVSAENANTLLASLLAPRTPAAAPSGGAGTPLAAAAAPGAPSPSRGSSAPNEGAASLMALLSRPTAPAASPAPSQAASTPLPPSAPHTPAAAAFASRAAPSVTPVSNLGTPSPFDFVSPFDVLESRPAASRAVPSTRQPPIGSPPSASPQPREATAGSSGTSQIEAAQEGLAALLAKLNAGPRTTPTSAVFHSPVTPASKSQAAAPAPAASNGAQAKASLPVDPTPSASPVASLAQTAAPAAHINKSLHATRHLAGLHASSGFSDEMSSGLASSSSGDAVHLTLDLDAPQPLGANSLHPAKLEVSPLALLPSAFVSPSSADATPVGRVAALGQSALYVMSKGRARLLHSKTGVRQVLRAEGLRSLEVARAGGDGPWRILGLGSSGAEDVISAWEVPASFGLEEGSDARALRSFEVALHSKLLGALWADREARRALALEADGHAVLFEPASAEVKPVRFQAASARPSAFALSADGSLLCAVVEAKGALTATLSCLGDAGLVEQRALSLSPPSGVQTPAPTFAGLLGSSVENVRVIVLGFDDGTAFGLYDATTGKLCARVSLAAEKSVSPWTLLRVHHARPDVLLLASAHRASLLVLPFRFAATSGSQQSGTAGAALFARPAGAVSSTSVELGSALEYALPEPCTAFHIAPADGGELMAAAHPGGIHFVHMPALPPAEASLEAPQSSEEVVEPVPSLQQTQAAAEPAAVEAKPAAVEAKREAPSSSVVQPVAEQPDATPTAPEQGAQKTDQKAADAVSAPTNGQASREQQAEPATPQVAEAPKQPVAAQGSDDAPRSEDLAKSSSSIAEPQHASAPELVVAAVQELKKGNGSTTSSAPASPTPHKRTRRSKNASNKEVAAEASDGGLKRSMLEMDAQIAATSTAVPGLTVAELKPLLESMEQRLLSRLSQAQPAPAPAPAAPTSREIVAALLPQLGPAINESVRQHMSVVTQTLPAELQRQLASPAVSAQLAASLGQALFPGLQRLGIDTVTRALVPQLEQLTVRLASGLESALASEMTGVRKEIVAQQSEALLQAEDSLREMAQRMEAMQAHLEKLLQDNERLQHVIAELKVQRMEVAAAHLASQHQPQQSQPPPQQQQQPQPQHQQYYQPPPVHQYATAPPQQQQLPPHYASTPMHQPSQPMQPPQQSSYESRPSVSYTSAAPASEQRTQARGSTPAPHEVEDILIAALSSPSIETDMSPVSRALSRLGSADRVLYGPGGTETCSQPVVLALLHRLATSLGTPTAPLPEQCVPWIATLARILRPDNPAIAAYYRVCHGAIANALQAIGRAQSSTWWGRELLRIQESLAPPS